MTKGREQNQLQWFNHPIWHDRSGGGQVRQSHPHGDHAIVCSCVIKHTTISVVISVVIFLGNYWIRNH